MSMKKKFLALALAGAVAMPVVANASVQGANVTGLDNAPQYGQVDITGKVDTSTGQAAQGQISVELPTNMGFTVDRDGHVITADNGAYTVTNRGQAPVDIYVSSFTETDLQGGISIVDADQLTTQSTTRYHRGQVSLTLKGNTGSIANLGKLTSEVKIFDSLANQGTMVLTGVAGTTNNNEIDTKGASETFKVKFKITKEDLI